MGQTKSVQTYSVLDFAHEDPDQLIKINKRVWNLPKGYDIAVVPNSTFGQPHLSSLAATHGGLERCKVDAAQFLCIDKKKNSFRKIASSAVSTVCQFGEIDLDLKFYPLGCATFLSKKVLLTANHVVSAVGDTSRMCVRIERNFTAANGRAECDEFLIRIDVVGARVLSERDVCILSLNDATATAVDYVVNGSIFSPLTMSNLSDFVMVMNTDAATRHTCVNIGESPTSDIGAQIATHVIAEGTFGACGAAVYNEDGCISGVYIGAVVDSKFTKGVMSINDIIINELNDYKNSKLAVFLRNKLHSGMALEYHDWINPFDRLNSYVQEGTMFEELRLTMSFNVCVLHCLGTGGRHRDVQKYNKKIIMESDHFPPFLAYQLSTKWNINYYCDKKKRVNEEELPTVLLPYAFHRAFITTGHGAAATVFATELAGLMNKTATFKDAIQRNIEEYQKAGLFKQLTFLTLNDETGFKLSKKQAADLILQFKEGIKAALVQHQTLGFIDFNERVALGEYTDARR